MNYRASALAHFRIQLYAAPDQPLPEHPSELGDYPLLASRELSGATTLELEDERGRRSALTVRPVMRTNDFASALQLLRHGVGIGPLPDLIARESVARGELVQVLPHWHLSRGTLFAISLGGAQAPARVRVFREFLRQQLGPDSHTG